VRRGKGRKQALLLEIGKKEKRRVDERLPRSE
jgi:hypothetical protein